MPLNVSHLVSEMELYGPLYPVWALQNLRTNDWLIKVIPAGYDHQGILKRK